jgi:hypothetical protein
VSTALGQQLARRRGLGPLVLPLAGIACAAAGGAVLVGPGGLRLAVAGVALAVVAIIGLTFPRHLLYGLFVWLAGLGLVRRLVPRADAAPVDPLLVVGAAALVVLALAAARQGAVRGGSALSKGVLLLALLFCVGAFNPYQGGLATGIGGLFFVLLPLLGFWIGKVFCDDTTLSGLLKLVGALALASGLYGLVQTFSHFPSWDQAWIQNLGYSALHVGDTIRPFGTFSSAQEYGNFLGIGLAVWICFGLRTRLVALTVAVSAVIGVAVFYQSSRSLVVYLLLALGLAVAARLRLPPLGAGLVAVVFLVALFGVVSAVGETTPGSSPTAVLAAHQIQGLADPLNPESSTLLGHVSNAAQGLRSVSTYPLGEGTGVISIASSKFGGVGADTELDPSNAAVALGIPGLLVYLMVLFIAFPRAYRVALARRDALSAVVLCVLVVTLFQWLNGGQYAVAPLPWLVLGWLDRPGQRVRLHGGRDG